MRAGLVIALTETDEDGMPYDLAKESVRRKVMKMIEVQKPFMLVMRPPDVAKTELEEGIKHVQFAIELCNLQHQAGRRFMMEHPANATSWC